MIRLVELEDVLPLVNERHDSHRLLNKIIAQSRIVDGDTSELVKRVVCSRDEGIGDVGNVEACITLASDRLKTPACQMSL